ncbi:uncharacterized protein PFL1_02761 [Pseudozyma flocculosa PF-1]|uniref:Uncharacterized protein n=2 Tax=Pseudozyma flocculosa TaxID=84751 RepID=A0A5C3F2H7_9BASI|nr:uncharacterized protein PFL1_02761 [Pseudozyma flocculosa PF-1]EPQ29542.1 hypothetical protein PFL1_02761 [Pseudozyma flocculosa PF-1]SPO38086.1 uncharacterized protein PSFLO_03563 [Pseudozyma flocculosa]
MRLVSSQRRALCVAFLHLAPLVVAVAPRPASTSLRSGVEFIEQHLLGEDDEAAERGVGIGAVVAMENDFLRALQGHHHDPPAAATTGSHGGYQEGPSAFHAHGSGGHLAADTSQRSQQHAGRVDPSVPHTGDHHPYGGQGAGHGIVTAEDGSRGYHGWLADPHVDYAAHSGQHDMSSAHYPGASYGQHDAAAEVPLSISDYDIPGSLEQGPGGYIVHAGQASSPQTAFRGHVAGMSPTPDTGASRAVAEDAESSGSHQIPVRPERQPSVFDPRDLTRVIREPLFSASSVATMLGRAPSALRSDKNRIRFAPRAMQQTFLWHYRAEILTRLAASDQAWISLIYLVPRGETAAPQDLLDIMRRVRRLYVDNDGTPRLTPVTYAYGPLEEPLHLEDFVVNVVVVNDDQASRGDKGFLHASVIAQRDDFPTRTARKTEFQRFYLGEMRLPKPLADRFKR